MSFIVGLVEVKKDDFSTGHDLLELYSAIQDWIQWMNINKSMNSSILNSKINMIFNKEYPSLKYNIFEYFFTYSLKLKLLSFDEEFILRNWHIYLILNNLLELKNPEIKQIFINLSELVFTTKKFQYNSLKTLILKDVFISKDDIILFNLKILQELRFNRCVYSNNNRFNDEKKNDWVDLWLPNLKHLEVDFLDKYKEESNELYSILLRSSPLISNI
ncbi:1354_t:CDS:2 [Rhizophagus irregularis]|nr:1354_t:CDS:2 [Rhizophagus irregularis]